MIYCHLMTTHVFTYRQKIGSGHAEGLLIQSMPNGIAIEFERSPTMERMKLVLSEIFLINAQVLIFKLSQKLIQELHSKLFTVSNHGAICSRSKSILAAFKHPNHLAK